MKMQRISVPGSPGKRKRSLWLSGRHNTPTTVTTMSWKCKKCDEVLEDHFQICLKCGKNRNGPRQLSMPCSTTPFIPCREIAVIKGIVSGVAILGSNFLLDASANVTDLLGGRSDSYENQMRKGRAIALDEMEEEAVDLGAEAIVGVHISYENVNGMQMVTASGTAVLLSPISQTSGHGLTSQSDD